MSYKVSILARPEGRALPGIESLVGWIKRVSILARPEGRALQTMNIKQERKTMFQSSPAPKGGRYPARRLPA